MRKELIHIIILITGGVLISCDNEVDLLEPAVPIPVVYGILCPDDSIHQIRLSKTFDGSSTPEVEANISDSLYFADAIVYLELRSDQGQVLERLQMIRTVIDDRGPGIFASHPNIVYEGQNYQLRQGFLEVEMIYHLTINLPAFDQSIFATAAVPEDRVISTNIDEGENLNIFNYFDHPKSVSVGSSGYFATELIIEFFYENKINEKWAPDSFIYKRYFTPSTVVAAGDIIEFTPDWLYRLFASRIQEDENVTYRRFNSFEIRKKLISPEYSYYLSSLEFSPDYYMNIFSNVVNGKGLFAAYSISKITGITFNNQMLDSLALGQYTKKLRFLRWH